MDLWKQMSSSKCSFTCICGIFWPLNPSTTTVYARSAFYSNLRFTLSLQSAFYTQSAFYPWSAVCSPQSAVCAFYTDRELYSLKYTLGKTYHCLKFIFPSFLVHNKQVMGLFKHFSPKWGKRLIKIHSFFVNSEVRNVEICTYFLESAKKMPV